jgi:uncharacterized Fe-S cluster-containing protein
MTIDDLWRQETNQLKELLKYAYFDINYLLIEGFDSNVRDCEMEGVKNTIKEIEMVVGKKHLEKFQWDLSQ